MSNRALLIGSQTYGLTGANADVDLMAETLSGLGFDVSVHKDDDATRDAILDAYRRLIADTPYGSTDAVVVYYSGHGGRTALEDWQARQVRGQRTHLRYLVPYDMSASTESDFRGLLAEELSALQRDLTTKTANVTTILDCCHSGTMSRDVDVLPKAVGRDFALTAALPILDALDASVSTANEWSDSNPLAVRVVACDPLQSAYERPSSLGGRHGALTEQLVLALRALGDRPVSWRTLGERIRRSVTATLPMQRPEVEGPADRVPFSLRTRPQTGSLPVTLDGEIPTIAPAGLFGVSVGDEFRLVDDDDGELARATVTELSGDRAVLKADSRADRGWPASISAEPIRTSSRRPVRLDVTPTAVAALDAAISASSRLQVAQDDDEAVATIAESSDGLRVLDGSGLAVNQRALAVDDKGTRAAVAAAENIATAERLRALGSGSGDDALDGTIVVRLASHAASGTQPRASSGERLYPDERVSLSITNATDDTVYVALFDIDPSYRITLLSSDEPSGWRLPAHETKVVGGPEGAALVWDESVPDDEPRLETLLVVAATEPQQYGLLATPGDLSSRGEAPSQLESLLAEAGSGSRSWAAAAPAGATAPRYRVEAIDFFLTPGPKPDVDEPRFAITELPDTARRSLQPRALVAAPDRIAVRLATLRVRNNKALFRAAVRLDALVITAGDDGRAVGTPFTHRFSGVADGDLLPMDNLLLYFGAVRDFLDLAVWVNRDDSKGADLAQLFAEAMHDPATQGALTVVGGVVLAAPVAAAAVGAVASIATLVRVGSGLVQAWVGKEIGLYRTSFLAYEQFGLGRQPAHGLRQAQGIEFAYEVVDAGGHPAPR